MLALEPPAPLPNCGSHVMVEFVLQWVYIVGFNYLDLFTHSDFPVQEIQCCCRLGCLCERGFCLKSLKDLKSITVIIWKTQSDSPPLLTADRESTREWCHDEKLTQMPFFTAQNISHTTLLLSAAVAQELQNQSNRTMTGNGQFWLINFRYYIITSYLEFQMNPCLNKLWLQTKKE